MATHQTLVQPKRRPDRALTRAAMRFRAWWDGDDPRQMIDELAGMAEREMGGDASAVPMSSRLKAWWDGSDAAQPPAAPGGDAEARRLKVVHNVSAVRGGIAPAAASQATKLPPEKLEHWTKLWGEGFCEPFDKNYAPDLVKSFALNEKMTVVDLGARLGGGTRAVAERYKVWITGMDPDPEYAAAGMQFSIKAGLKSRAPIVPYNIEKLALPAKRYNCLFATETFHRAKNKRQLFTSVAQSLTDQGQLVFTDFVLATPDDQAPEIAAWRQAEPFESHPWSRAEIAKCLKDLRFDTRVDEDMTDRYRRLALRGWHESLLRLTGERDAGRRPSRPMLMQLLDDAELWVLRLRALETGALQVRRYFALIRR